MAKILIVDDDPDFTELASVTLSTLGNHEVETAGDGHEALDKARAFLPDLIISDVIMPHMNGWQLLQALKADASMDVPVIFTSALGRGAEHRVRGLRLGANDFLPKPVEPEELLLRVENSFAAPFVVVHEVDDCLLPERDMHGKLERIGLASLLMMFEMERRSGILVLSKGPANLWMSLRDGALVRADLQRGAATTSGLDAVRTGLSWTSGTFEFALREVTGADEIGVPTTHILLENARLSDEAVRG